MGSMWEKQTSTPSPGRQSHNLPSCSLTVLKESKGVTMPQENQFEAIKYTITVCPNTEWTVLISQY